MIILLFEMVLFLIKLQQRQNWKISLRQDFDLNKRPCQEGCIAKGDLCQYQKMKANWNQFHCISDLNAITKIQRLKTRYDAAILLKIDNHKMIEELKNTFHFEAPDFEQQIMSDPVLSPGQRRAKLDMLLDYIGPRATR